MAECPLGRRRADIGSSREPKSSAARVRCGLDDSLIKHLLPFTLGLVLVPATPAGVASAEQRPVHSPAAAAQQQQAAGSAGAGPLSHPIDVADAQRCQSQRQLAHSVDSLHCMNLVEIGAIADMPRPCRSEGSELAPTQSCCWREVRADHSGSGSISPLMIFITSDAFTNSAGGMRNVTLIRLSFARSNSSNKLSGVNSTRRTRK